MVVCLEGSEHLLSQAPDDGVRHPSSSSVIQERKIDISGDHTRSDQAGEELPLSQKGHGGEPGTFKAEGPRGSVIRWVTPCPPGGLYKKSIDAVRCNFRTQAPLCLMLNIFGCG